MENQENYLRIEKAIAYLQANFTQQPELDEVAEQVHLSPYHFQRMFTEWAGISPKRFLQYLTVDYLKQRLHETRSTIEMADVAGLSSQSRVYDLFTTLEAVTPNSYKQHGSGIDIYYGVCPTPFGGALIGSTDKGICWLSFLRSDEDLSYAVMEMKKHWHNSVFYEDKALATEWSTRIFNRNAATEKLHLFVRGTNFQVKVWEALLKIPFGKLTTYQNIATGIHQAGALQAVGNAVGSNHIAYLIPCHRVIRKNGVLGEYRWTPSRKKIMIGWEMAKMQT